MLSAVGVIAEFNPFHNGHRYLLRTARRVTRADAVVVVMSGNWVQRGQPAVVDKWQRTRMALRYGADLVVELPVQFAVQSAGIFASRAVSLVDQLKCRNLAFGCEHSDWDFDRLARVKLRANPRWFKNYRLPYADLARKAFRRQTGISVTQPNDLLALNYARAKRALSAPVKLWPVQRNDQHSRAEVNLKSEFSSSTALRRRLFSTRKRAALARWVPNGCLADLVRPWFSWRWFWPELRYRLVESSPGELRAVYQMREGLEFRLKRGAVRSVTFRQFIRAVKTKRYTYSSLMRLCFYVLINFKKSNWLRVQNRQYLRILGFNRTGQRYLSQIKKRVTVPMITNVNQQALERDLEWDFRAGMLLEMKNHRYEDLYRHPVIK